MQRPESRSTNLRSSLAWNSWEQSVFGVNRRCLGARFTTPIALDQSFSSSPSSEHQQAILRDPVSPLSQGWGRLARIQKDSQVPAYFLNGSLDRIFYRNQPISR